MGKFDKALRKAEAAARLAPAKAPAKKSVKIKGNEIEALRLDTKTVAETPAPVPSGMNDRRLVTLTDHQSAAAEQFRLLRTKIMCKDMACGPRTLMVTSPQTLDGKSTVASNLAVAIAQGINEYVLLVDCDLRKPSLHKLFGIGQADGLREYLEEGNSVAPYLKTTEVNKLTLLPAGHPPLNPAELLSSEKMRQLVEELKNRYQDRHIIFDTAPAGFAAETGFLSTVVDGVLMVIRLGKTSSKATMQAIEHIPRDKILGVVSNADNERTKNYHYYYRYYQKGK
jgi:exopolysaccharide/PEP-CTERM locus tyrosine autokinase